MPHVLSLGSVAPLRTTEASNMGWLLARIALGGAGTETRFAETGDGQRAIGGSSRRVWAALTGVVR